MAQNFLIRWGDQFLLAWETVARWTTVPSLAAHFTYEDADETAQDLQEIGFECVVTDIFGNVATVEVIQRELKPPERGAGIVLANSPEYGDGLDSLLNPNTEPFRDFGGGGIFPAP